jgi:hypothetical protein
LKVRRGRGSPGPLNAAFGAQQQSHAQFILQGFDLLTDGGLRYMKFFGGTREVLPAGHGDEVFQMTQFHPKTVIGPPYHCERNNLFHE